MVVQTEQEPQTAGELIRFWRTRRGLSQLELSLDANVPTKHLSFVETGRSSPSRQLLVHLAQHLDLPINERNRLLLAGGFAPPYLELPYDGEVMRPLRESLERLLEAHEPNPALIVDGLWNLIESNRAASLLWDGVDPELLEPPINMLRLGVHPGGLPRISSMTAACNAPLIHRLNPNLRLNEPDLAAAVLSGDPVEPPSDKKLLIGATTSLGIWVSGQVGGHAFRTPVGGRVPSYKTASGIRVVGPEEVDAPEVAVSSPPFVALLADASDDPLVRYTDTEEWLREDARARREVNLFLPVVLGLESLDQLTLVTYGGARRVTAIARARRRPLPRSSSYSPAPIASAEWPDHDH